MTPDPVALENTLLGHCRLIRKLGQGGMGAVWLARHETLDKEVAVKILPDGYANDPESVPRFLREAKAAARLDHPNVVQILDAGTDQGTHFIVMQFVDGTDLEKTLKKRGPFASADALAVGKRVALALGAAHKLGIVHRDIKPANILLTKQGRVMVADFGLARDVKGGPTITAPQEAIGTPHYISPEQARGEEVDGRSDLYSLGGTLYTLLTGKTPFTGASPVAIAMKHVSADEKPVPLREHVPDLPEEVQALVEKLMSKKPGDRYQSGEELAAAIDVIKSGPASIGTAAHPKLSSPGRKWGLFLAGGVVLAAALVVGLLAGLSGPGKAEQAFRNAGLAATDTERVARYREVASLFPGTSWASDAQAKAVELRKGLLDRELLAVKASDFDGKLPFKQVLTQVGRLRSAYPEGAAKIDAMETELDRARVIARAKEFAEALRIRKSEDKAERFKEFIDPETWKKSGETWVMPAVRTAVGITFGIGMRIEEVDVATDRLTLERGKTASTPLKATLFSFSGKTKDRSTHKVVVTWHRQDGDWYLQESGIREEK